MAMEGEGVAFRLVGELAMWRLASLLAIGVAIATATARAQVPPPFEPSLESPPAQKAVQPASSVDLPPTAGDPKAPYKRPPPAPPQATESTPPGPTAQPEPTPPKPKAETTTSNPNATAKSRKPKPAQPSASDGDQQALAEPGKPLSFRCFVRDVMASYDRTHVRCYNKRGAINFFAVDTAQPIAATVLRKALSGMQNGKPVTITYAPGGDLNPPNCGVENCRRLLDIRN